MNQSLPKLPIGIQDFEKLRQGHFIYVDKTQYLYQLLQQGNVYFLARPRRFGKSLMISTLEAIFKGRKELFKKTWIESSDYDWQIHPVIRVDMGEMPTKETPEIFKSALLQWLKNIATQYDIALSEPVISLGSCLSELIDTLEKKYGKVVVLIDEYDKPILDNIINPVAADIMHDILRQFYTILKSQDGNLRFVILTGVTKFSKVSIFSGLNNLQDISLTEKYTSLCGYTQSELETVF